VSDKQENQGPPNLYFYRKARVPGAKKENPGNGFLWPLSLGRA
jgi:hypothetical protein